MHNELLVESSTDQLKSFGHTSVQGHSGVLKCVKWFSMFWFYLCDSEKICTSEWGVGREVGGTRVSNEAQDPVPLVKHEGLSSNSNSKLVSDPPESGWHETQL